MSAERTQLKTCRWIAFVSGVLFTCVLNSTCLIAEELSVQIDRILSREPAALVATPLKDSQLLRRLSLDFRNVVPTSLASLGTTISE
jgi:hypothetical protein